jgi:hypothetical protein
MAGMIKKILIALIISVEHFLNNLGGSVGKYYTRMVLVIFSFFLFASSSYAISPVMLHGMSGGSASGLGYLEDANCAGAWYMNADGSTGETDRCVGGSEDLAVSASDTIPTASPVTAYSGASRDFENGDADFLYHADGGTTDISGAEQGLSVCGWFSLESSGVTQYLVSKIALGGQTQYSLLFYTESLGLIFTISNDGSAYNFAAGSVDVSSGWHHSCGVYDPVGNEILLYVDGGEDDTTAHTTGIFNGNGLFIIGESGFGQGTYGFDGLLDEIIVFDRVLTPLEVLDIYTNGVDGSKGAND